jgi:hypothetical protein
MFSKIYLNSSKWPLAVLLILCLNTCKGPQGDTGPQGSAGPQGIQGIAGPAGAANIIVSPWVKVPETDWVPNQDFTYFVVTKEDTKITQTVLDKGVIMVYYKNTGRDNVVFSLPSTNGELTLGYFMAVRENKGSMNFDLSFTKPRLKPIDFDLEFRWITIPPQAGGRLKALDLQNYNTVKHEFHIAD